MLISSFLARALRTPRLRTSLVALVVAALAPVFILVIFNSLQSQDAGLRVTERELLVAARLAALSTERSVEGARHVLGAIASTPAIQRGDAEQCALYFKNLRGKLTAYANAGVLDLQGNVSCQIAEVDKPANLADRSYFQQVLKTQSFAIGEYVVGRMTGRAGIAFAEPVYDPMGRLRGVAFVSLDLRTMAVDSPIEVPAGVALVVTDRNNFVVATDVSHAALLGSDFTELGLYNKTLANASRVFEQLGADGRSRFYATSPVGRVPSAQLFVTASIGKDTVLAVAKDRLTLSLALLTLLAAIGVIGARWIGNYTIVVPMRRLVNQVNELGRTGMATGAPIILPDNSNELNELSDAFHRLTEVLNARKQERDQAAELLKIQIEQQLVVQKELSVTVHKLTEAQRLAHLGSWEVSLADHRTVWSEEVFRIFGIEASDFAVTYDTFLALVHPEDRAGVEADHQSACNKLPLDHEYRIVRPCGAIRYVRDRSEFVFDQDGTPVALTGTILDVTDLRGAQSRADAASELLSVAHRVADMGSWDMDVVNHRLRFSPEACHLFGIAPQAFDGRYETYLAAIVPEDQPLILQAQRQGIRQKKMQDVEYRVRLPDGEIRWMFERGNLAFDDFGNEVRRTGMVMDVTERKQTQEAMRQLNLELEDRVKRRTAQLQASNSELEAFSYSVSHDLRSPLKTIDGFGHLLGQADGERLSDKGARYLSRIRAAAKHMGELIDGLLALAKSGSEPLRREDVDLSVIARRVEEECRDREPTREVKVLIPPALMARGDSLLLSVVIHNLLTNAWKFTAKQAGARIEVGSEKDSDENTVYFIKDNGAGFNMAYAKKLFGTFERLHSPSDFAGTGVGLAIVKRVIERHGGRVWAEGEEDKGASFYFVLPSQENEFDA